MFTNKGLDMKKMILGSLVMGIVACNLSLSHAQEVTPYYYGEGYTIIEGVGMPTNDLTQIINKRVQARTIKEGLEIILSGTGWRLANDNALNPQIHSLYSAPWASQWDFVGADTLKNILDTIGGEGWQVVVDPVNRLIGYDVKPQFRGI